jgi:hypothetical protein
LRPILQTTGSQELCYKLRLCILVSKYLIF